MTARKKTTKKKATRKKVPKKKVTVRKKAPKKKATARKKAGAGSARKGAILKITAQSSGTDHDLESSQLRGVRRHARLTPARRGGCRETTCLTPS